MSQGPAGSAYCHVGPVVLAADFSCPCYDPSCPCHPMLCTDAPDLHHSVLVMNRCLAAFVLTVCRVAAAVVACRRLDRHVEAEGTAACVRWASVGWFYMVTKC